MGVIIWSHSMTSSLKLRLIPIVDNKSLPMIASQPIPVLSVDSSIWNLCVTILLSVNCGRLNFTLFSSVVLKSPPAILYAILFFLTLCYRCLTHAYLMRLLEQPLASENVKSLDFSLSSLFTASDIELGSWCWLTYFRSCFFDLWLQMSLSKTLLDCVR